MSEKEFAKEWEKILTESIPIDLGAEKIFTKVNYPKRPKKMKARWSPTLSKESRTFHEITRPRPPIPHNAPLHIQRSNEAYDIEMVNYLTEIIKINPKRNGQIQDLLNGQKTYRSDEYCDKEMVDYIIFVMKNYPSKTELIQSTIKDLK